MRQLKYHEKKLLKKVDFLVWKKENTLREIKILRKYHIQRREDYTHYNKLCGQVKKIAAKLKQLDPTDPFRIETSDKLLNKLYNAGFISNTKSLTTCESITPSALCRRRLPVIMVVMKFCQTVKEAVTFVEQGHVRVGPNIVTDPAFLVSRAMSDFVQWVDQSKIKRHVLKYNNTLDDFDLLNF